MKSKLAASIEKAHNELWKRFVYRPFGILLDFAGLDGEISIPTPEECKEGKINAMSWWTPIENGAFFNGLYLSGLCDAWKLTGDEEKKREAHVLSKGLILLAEVGETPGFIARGVSFDGKSHYRIGSDDQTAPWFYGLWKYARSGIPADNEKAEIIALMERIAKAMKAKGWYVPCDGTDQTRGDFIGKDFRDVARLLFILRAMYDLTGDEGWLEEYNTRLMEKPEGSNYSRLEICEGGMSWDMGRNLEMSYQLWVIGGAQASLKALVCMEQNEEIRLKYLEGMRINGYMAMPLIFRYIDFDTSAGYDINWRIMNNLWKPQNSVEEAVELALEQLRVWEKKAMPARIIENRYMREPLFAAWIISMSGDRALIDRAENLVYSCLCHFDWSKLYTSLFFIAECTYYEMMLTVKSYGK